MITNNLENLINKIRYPKNSNETENIIEYYTEVIQTISIERDAIKQIYDKFSDVVIGDKYSHGFWAESAKPHTEQCEFYFDQWNHQHNYHYASPYVVCALKKIYTEQQGIPFAEVLRINKSTYDIRYTVPLPHWRDQFIGYSDKVVILIEEYLNKITEEQQVGW